MKPSEQDRDRKIRMKRAWRAANPDKVAAHDRKKNYGLGDAEYQAMLARQNGRCLICTVSDATAVDHCHATRRIRGLLCRACNAGLGFFRDDARMMRAAAEYLTRQNREQF